jgi:hypothetical protein
MHVVLAILMRGSGVLLCARGRCFDGARGAPDENKRCTNQGHAAMLINANLHAWHSLPVVFFPFSSCTRSCTMTVAEE